MSGTITTFVGALGDSAALAPYTARVARANGWDTPARTAPHYPPFTHVIYIIKENRTFDQVLSDLPGVDGDTSLLFFRPRRRAESSRRSPSDSARTTASS